MPVSCRPLPSLLVALALSVLAPTASAADCGWQVIADWQDNDVVDTSFEPSCYARALKLEPADARQYSGFRAAVQRAIARDRGIKAAEARDRQAAAERSSGAGGAGDATFEPSPAAPVAPAPPAEADAEPAEAPPSEPEAAPAVPADPSADEPEPAVVVPPDEPVAVDEGPAPASATAPAEETDDEPAPETTTSDDRAVLALAPSDPFGTGGATIGSSALPGPILVAAGLAAVLAALGCAGLAAQRRREHAP